MLLGYDHLNKELTVPFGDADEQNFVDALLDQVDQVNQELKTLDESTQAAATTDGNEDGKLRSLDL